jgi:micrococcal nuclease
VPVGSVVVLEADPTLDAVDRYGRLLRYLRRGATNVNIAMVQSGAAAPYFYRGERGRYAEELLDDAIRAKVAKRGLWGACPGTARSEQAGGDEPGGSSSDGRGFAGGTGCDPAYPGVCIPPPPPDLDCHDVRYTNFVVRPPDPHQFDGDHDGHGCES